MSPKKKIVSSWSGLLGYSVVQSFSRILLFATPWTAARLPCTVLSPGVCSNSCPWSPWCSRSEQIKMMASHSDWVSGLQQVRLSPWGQGALATEHTAGVCPNQPGFPGGSVSKEPACSAGDLGSIPGSGRSPGEENGLPLQYSCLENPMDRGAWQDTVHGVTKRWTPWKLLSMSTKPYKKYKILRR